jgi:hypothetical protein
MITHLVGVIPDSRTGSEDALGFITLKTSPLNTVLIQDSKSQAYRPKFTSIFELEFSLR